VLLIVIIFTGDHSQQFFNRKYELLPLTIFIVLKGHSQSFSYSPNDNTFSADHFVFYSTQNYQAVPEILGSKDRSLVAWLCKHMPLFILW
jgi:hypothetical protein